jgi:large subunit ribosomal protein L17
MRHRRAGVKLNRTTSHRQAMFRNMVTSLLKHDRIQTTDVKAKELRRWVDHIIGLAKRGDLHARRQAMAIVREKNVVHNLFEEAGRRFGNLNGGYSRIVKIGRRPGDAAPISLIELMSVEAKPKKSKKKSPEPQVKADKPEKMPAAPDAGGASAAASEGQTAEAKAPEAPQKSVPADSTEQNEAADRKDG